MEPRFEAFPDPWNNWIIWDLEENSVAEIGGYPLQYLSEARARAFCSLLNRLLVGAPQPPDLNPISPPDTPEALVGGHSFSEQPSIA